MKERKFFPLRADPFSEGRQILLPVRVIFPRGLSIHFKRSKTNTCNNIGTLDFPVNFISCCGNKSCHWINLKVVVCDA